MESSWGHTLANAFNFCEEGELSLLEFQTKVTCTLPEIKHQTKVKVRGKKGDRPGQFKPKFYIP